MENNVHPFQRTLGPGPYQFIGVGEVCFSETFGARYIGPDCERGAGTCAHCGHAIKYVYVIETAEKRRFGVGSDCIMKTNMPAKILSQVEMAERKRQKEQRATRKAKRGDAARASLASLISLHSEAMKNLPHPSQYQASQNKTLLDYSKWILDNSNDGGIVIALKKITQTLGL